MWWNHEKPAELKDKTFRANSAQVVPPSDGVQRTHQNPSQQEQLETRYSVGELEKTNTSNKRKKSNSSLSHMFLPCIPSTHTLPSIHSRKLKLKLSLMRGRNKLSDSHTMVNHFSVGVLRKKFSSQFSFLIPKCFYVPFLCNQNQN